MPNYSNNFFFSSLCAQSQLRSGLLRSSSWKVERHCSNSWVNNYYTTCSLPIEIDILQMSWEKDCEVIRLESSGMRHVSTSIVSIASVISWFKLWAKLSSNLKFNRKGFQRTWQEWWKRHRRQSIERHLQRRFILRCNYCGFKASESFVHIITKLHSGARSTVVSLLGYQIEKEKIVSCFTSNSNRVVVTLQSEMTWWDSV